ncbi:MAG: dihydrodipicolinate synthase family protein [Planctomycetota bacterium]|nr:dihydrodipicolinate synthase family protein [Planctomycetota bacterium]
MTETLLNGLIAATYTPMAADGSLLLDGIEAMTEQLLGEGVAGFYVCGSTGEGVSLSTSERKAVTAAFVRASAGRGPVVVQVGHNSLAEACDLARHAQEVGATAVSAAATSYFKVDSTAMLVQCMGQIAGAAPDLPFYYYHIPLFTGVDVDLLEFLGRAGETIPNFAGVKYTTPRIDEFQACCELEKGRYEMLWGTDEMLLPAWSMGIHGAVGSTYNLAAPLYRRLIQAAEAGDLAEAKRLQMLSIDMIRTIGQFPFHPAMKRVMGSIGIECGPCRLPQRQLTDQESKKLLGDLERMGFYDWARSPVTQPGA